MEEIQHWQPQSLKEIHDVNLRTLDENLKTYYESSPRRERKCWVKIVCKSRPLTSWWNDRDMRRKRRMAKYKLYAAEGKLKSSMKKGFRSLNTTCTKVVARINI